MKSRNRMIGAQGLAAAVLAAALLAGCQNASVPGSAASSSPESAPPAVDMEKASEPLARSVQVDGVLYWDTGLLDHAARCGVMDGELTSTVEPDEAPGADDQSNFGTGFGYQRGMLEHTIEVYIEDEGWCVFAEEGVSLEQLAQQLAENGAAETIPAGEGAQTQPE